MTQCGPGCPRCLNQGSRDDSYGNAVMVTGLMAASNWSARTDIVPALVVIVSVPVYCEAVTDDISSLTNAVIC